MATSIKHVAENIQALDFSMEFSHIEMIGSHIGNETRWISPSDILFDSSAVLEYRPSILSIASSLVDGAQAKPIRVEPEEQHYRLIEGKARFLAWVSAFGYKTPILAIVDYL